MSTRNRTRTALCALALAAASLATATGAAADPAGGFPVTFTDCQGPAGAPSTFDAVLAGFTRALVVDSTSVFVSVVIVRDGVEIYSRPGFDGNVISTLTCKFESPLTGFKYVITGFFTPVG